MFFNANSDFEKELACEPGRQSLEGRRRRIRRLPMGRTDGATNRSRASVSASYSEGTDDAQWIVNQDGDGDGVTDYVYGTLDRHVVDVTFRCRPSCSHSSRSATTQTSGSLRCPARICSRRSRSRTTRTSIPSRSAAPSSSAGSTSAAARSSLCGISRGRLFETGCLQTMERHRHRVRRRAHSHIDGQGQLLDQSVTRGPVRTMPESLPAMSLLRRFGRTASNFSGAR
jgi:hypothetical protein